MVSLLEVFDETHAHLRHPRFYWSRCRACVRGRRGGRGGHPERTRAGARSDANPSSRSDSLAFPRAKSGPDACTRSGADPSDACPAIARSAALVGGLAVQPSANRCISARTSSGFAGFVRIASNNAPSLSTTADEYPVSATIRTSVAAGSARIRRAAS